MTDLPQDTLGENEALSNRDKSRHNHERGLDSKPVQTEQYQDHAATVAQMRLCRDIAPDRVDPPYMAKMIVFTPNPHKLRVGVSKAEPGRFDWAITRDDVEVRRSAQSFGSRGASETDGDIALREVTKLWRNGR